MEFIKRNTPVLAIGLITAVIFIGIIIFSQKSPPAGPALVEVDKETLVAAHTPTMGPDNAPVTLVEFSDFQCPYCAGFAPEVKAILKKYEGNMRIAYRHYPLAQHTYAKKAAEAAQAAKAQGKFWEYHDRLFDNQTNLKIEDLLKYAAVEGLDEAKFKEDLDKGTYAGEINADIDYGDSIGIAATPTFYLNGKLIKLQRYGDLQKAVDDEFAKLGIQPTAGAVNETAPENTPAETPTQISQPEQTNEPAEILTEIVINFTATGFDQEEIEVPYGQPIKWVNQTDKEITIKQTVDKFEEFKQGVVLKPGGDYSMRLFGERLWVYKEVGSEKYGQIYIQPKVIYSVPLN